MLFSEERGGLGSGGRRGSGALLQKRDSVNEEDSEGK